MEITLGWNTSVKLKVEILGRKFYDNKASYGSN
jgi:hypothetical protein